MATTGTEFVITLRDALKRLGDESAAFVQSQCSEPDARSQAAVELTTFPRAESLVTVVAIGTMPLRALRNMSAYSSTR